MPFQFYCPQGHLLEGHESQMGQQGQCPMCGSMFMFPMMGGQTPPPAGMPGMMGGPAQYGASQGGMMQPGGYPAQQYGQPGMGQQPYGQPGFGGPQMGGPGMGGGPGFGGPNFGGPRNIGDRFAGLQENAAAQQEPQFAPPPEPEPEAPPEPRIFRILCPNGHELQTPEDMLGTQAMCPYCNAQMDLKYEDSVEFKQIQEREQRIKDEQTNRFWMKASIWGAIIVGLLFVGMIAMLFWPDKPR